MNERYCHGNESSNPTLQHNGVVDESYWYQHTSWNSASQHTAVLDEGYWYRHKNSNPTPPPSFSWSRSHRFTSSAGEEQQYSRPVHDYGLTSSSEDRWVSEQLQDQHPRQGAIQDTAMNYISLLAYDGLSSYLFKDSWLRCCSGDFEYDHRIQEQEDNQARAEEWSSHQYSTVGTMGGLYDNYDVVRGCGSLLDEPEIDSQYLDVRLPVGKEHDLIGIGTQFGST